MATLFGNGRTNNPTPISTSLRVQSSLQGVCIPIGAGRNRWAGNLINYAGFTYTPTKSPGAKGGLAGSAGKGNTGQYNYTVSGIVSFCEGGLLSFNRIYNGNYIDFLTNPSPGELADLSAIGIIEQEVTAGNTYKATFRLGNYTDAPDTQWASMFPSQAAIAYPGQACILFPNLGLGTSASFPSFTVDATWALSSDIPALGEDANPADWIEAFLTNADWGVQGFPASAIGDFATAQNYWRATGMLISPVLTSTTAGNSHLKELIGSLNADFRWSNGRLDIVPYGDVAVTGNGYTYTPDTTPVYDLGPDDFLPNQGSLGNAASADKVKVAFSRADITQIPNVFQLEYLDRANLFNPVVIYRSNDAQIAESARQRYGDKKSQHWFCLASAATVSCALQLHRAWTTINAYQFTLGRQFVLLDVLDLVAITEPALGLANQLVRITNIQENQDGTLTMTAEEVPLTASAPVYTRQASLGIARSASLSPGSINTPVIMELPGQLSKALQVQFAVCGQTPAYWGGCGIWISTDGTAFDRLGEITTAARMGVLTAGLPAVSTSPSGPTLDTTNTLAVDLTESLGVLTSGSSDDLAALTTVCLVDSELVAYQNAALTATSKYSLTTLERGCYGTQGSVVSHAVGAPFIRIDDAIFRWDYVNALIGKTVYFKFTSFNIYGTNEESLADVTAYSHVLSGTPTPNGIVIATATLTQVGIANTLAVTWEADPLAVSYVLDYSTDGGETYTAVTVSDVLSWQVPGLQVSTVEVRIAGVSANGVQGPYLAPVEVTGPPLNYAAGLGLSYNDLTSPAMQQALDNIANEEASILGAVDDAINAATALAATAANANANTTVQINAIKNTAADNLASLTQTLVTQATAQSAFAAEMTALTAAVGSDVATINQTLVVQANATTALAAEVTTLTTNVDDNIATINTTLTTQSSEISANATAISSLSASTSSSIATLTSEQSTQATTLTAVSGDITTLTAQANAATADDQIAWVASAGPSGAFGAWELKVTASGHASSSASMIVSADSGGTSSIFMVADQFAIGDPATNVVPFQTLSGGGLRLNGVEEVNGSIVSATLTSGGQPVLEIDFINGPIYFRA